MSTALRERRLRQFLRHERLSVAITLAEFTHHTAPRRPTMARARGGQMTPPPRAASTEYYRLDDDGDVLAARPTPLVEVRPQPGVLRHTGAHIVDFSPFVQILDDPVPQMGREKRKIVAPALDEQVIAVPKISLDRNSKRCPRRLPPLPYCSGLPSRSLTFQFLRVGRSWRPSRCLPRTGFNSALWSRSR